MQGQQPVGMPGQSQNQQIIQPGGGVVIKMNDAQPITAVGMCHLIY